MPERTQSSLAIAEPTRSVDLTDAELALLNGRCSEKVQAAVDAAIRRLTARDELPDLTAREAGFVADVVTSARETGIVTLTRRPISRCPICGRRAGYVRFKSGRRKGQEDHNRPLSLSGLDLERRMVTVRGFVKLGGCTDCVEPLIPVFAEKLRGIEAEVPDRLRADGEPKRTRYDNRHCTQCGWTGHAGQMRKLRTLMGDGFYPGGCPECDAENRFLGRTLIEHADGFTVVATTPVSTEGETP